MEKLSAYLKKDLVEEIKEVFENNINSKFNEGVFIIDGELKPYFWHSFCSCDYYFVEEYDEYRVYFVDRMKEIEYFDCGTISKENLLNYDGYVDKDYLYQLEPKGKIELVNISVFRYDNLNEYYVNDNKVTMN